MKPTTEPRIHYVLEYASSTKPDLPAEPRTLTTSSDISVKIEDGSYQVSWTQGRLNHERGFATALETIKNRLGERALTDLCLVARVNPGTDQRSVISDSVGQAYKMAYDIATGKLN